MAKRILIAVSVVTLVVIVVPSLISDRAAVTAAQGGQGMQMGMQDMMKMHDKMMADMKAEQAKLEELVKRMNSATGDAKVNVMAELLTEIVQSHRRMGEHMGTMHQHMMKMGK